MTDYFHLSAQPDELRAISSLGLAHLGDSVYETMVRAHLCLMGRETARGMHREKLRYVAAPQQAALSARILPTLTQEEADVFRRGKNACPQSVPRSCTREEYQTATALEALFGYLFLQGKTERLNELFIGMVGEGPAR